MEKAKYSINFLSTHCAEIIHFAEQEGLDITSLIAALWASAIYRYTQSDTINLIVDCDDDRVVYIYNFTGSKSLYSILFETHGNPFSVQDHVFQTQFYLSVSVGSNPQQIQKLDKFMLAAYLVLLPDKWEGQLEKQSTFLDDLAACSLADHLPVIMNNLITSWNSPIETVSLLGPEEYDTILNVWSKGIHLCKVEGLLHEKFSEQACRNPHQIAVICGDQSINYGELEERSNQLAGLLVEKGVLPQSRVCLYAERSIEMVIGMLSVLKTGAILTAFSPTTPRKLIESSLSAAEVKYVLVSRELENALNQAGLSIIPLPDGRLTFEFSMKKPEVAITPDQGALLLYTSGSTGIPKGVLYSHQGLLNRFCSHNHIVPLNPSDIYAQSSPLSSIDAYDEILIPLTEGCGVCIIPERLVRSPRDFVTALHEGQVTRMLLVPVLLEMILRVQEPIDKLLSHIRTWFVGGDRLNLELVDLFYQRFSSSALYNYYGLTEGDATILNTKNFVDPGDSSVPIGKPAPGNRVFILDDSLSLVPYGLPGQIYIGSFGLALGYYNQDKLTREHFLTNSLAKDVGNKLFKTGDLARYLPDGTIEFLGRKDFQVKIRGNTVNLNEVEDHLKKHHAVINCTVIAKPDQSGNLQLVGYVVRSILEVSVQDLRSYLLDRLPEYAVPTAIVFLPGLPLNANGKIDRASLPAPVYKDYAHSHTFQSPSTPLEIWLAQVWEKILNIDLIGVHDNFFDLGGDSIRVISLLAEIERELGRELPMNLFFQHATIAKLSKILTEQVTEPWSCLVPIQTGKQKGDRQRKPFFCVHADGGVFFYHRLSKAMGEDQPFYGLQARGLDGRETPFSSVEEMASQYISEIFTVQPHGPYYIGAFSMGGMIAFEIAHQIQAAGRQVGLLALFDAYGPNYPVIPSSKDLVKYKLTTHINSLRILPLTGQIRYLWKRGRSRTRKILARILGKIFYAMKLPLPRFIRYDVVRRTIEDVINKYQPQKYVGELTLFRASEQPSGCIPDPYLGWGDLVSGEIRIVDIFASHNSLLKEPFVQDLADRLKALIPD